MAAHGHTDIDAVPLPDALHRGLALLIGSSLERTGPKVDAKAATDAVLATLFGSDAVTFGRVRRLTAKDVADAVERQLGVDALSIAGLHELSELVRRVAPEIPACPACGRLSFSNTGGKTTVLPAGANCPFCAKASVALVPVTLKKLAWTDGRHVEPQTEHDLRSKTGERIPLTDPLIMAWVGGWMHLGLEQALKDADVPVYAFLAYMNLVRKALRFPRDAASLLQEPDEFGLKDVAAIRRAVREAAAFREEREIANVPARPGVLTRRGIDANDCPRVTVAGRPYLIEGHIGAGDKTDVYRGLLDDPLTELVVVKLCRDDADAPLLEREAANLRLLMESDAQGAYHFTRLVPQIVASGPAVLPDGDTRQATVYRYKNMFDWTLADVIREYPDGVDPQTMVWMWNRVLMLLEWVHNVGLVHGAIVPQHVLIHPMYHGATFLDWAYAVREGTPLTVPPSHDAYHPEEIPAGAPATAETDIAMSARCMLAVLGGNPATGDLPASVPQPIADFIRAHARCGKEKKGVVRYADALELHEAFGKVAEGVYGPRKYHSFHMPRPKRSR
jgi:hypothetical protein